MKKPLNHLCNGMMKTFDALDLSCPILGQYCLEASAGTGKTFAIQHIYLRLLICSDERAFSLDNILVITFTKAATRELKQRIYQTIKKAKQVLEAHVEDVQFPYLNQIFEKGENAIQQAIFSLQRALKCFDEAKIFTIHGFCYRCLKNELSEISLPIPVYDPDHMQFKEMASKEIIRIFREELNAMHFNPVQVNQLLKKFRNNVFDLADKIISSLQEKVSISNYADFSSLIQKLNASIVKLIAMHPNVSEKFSEFYEKTSQLSRKLFSPKFYKQAMQFSNWLKEGKIHITDLEDWIEEGELFLTAFKKHEEPAFFETIRIEILPHLKEALDVQILLLRLIKKCQEHFEILKLEKDIHFPDDILMMMKNFLSNEIFLQCVRSKYEAVIVDEFQDTDQDQWEILKTLFLDKISSFFLVGDPKQSIYAFRNADLRTYFKAVEEVGKGKKYFLDKNYRSSQSLVQALNTLFSEKEGNWLSTSFPMEYFPVLARKEEIKDIEDGIGNVHFFVKAAEKSRERSWPTKVSEEMFFFPYIAQEIIKLYKTFNIPLSNIAVLIKDRFQAERLKTFLKKLCIPSHSKGVVSIVETEAFEFFEVLLNCISTPRSLNLIKQFLGSPLVGYAYHELKGEYENSLLEATLVKFVHFESLIKEKGFAKFWNAFLQTSFKGDKIFLESIIDAQLEIYSDLSQMASILMEEEAKSLMKIEDYLSVIEEMRKNTIVYKSESYKRKNIVDGEYVQLLTTHMSKGLEFDIVFALGIASRHSATDDVIKIRTEKTHKLIPFEEEDEECKTALQFQDQEKMRLLYVALTRAKRRVYVPLYFDKEKRPGLGAASPIECFFQKRTEAIFPYLERLRKEAAITHVNLEDILFSNMALQGLQKNVNEYFFSEINLSFPKISHFSFSSLAKDSPLETHLEEMQADVISLHTLPPGSDTGHKVHFLIEKIIKSNFYFPFNKEKIVSFIDSLLIGTKLYLWKDVVFNLLINLFHLPLPNKDRIHFALKDIEPNQFISELEFLMPIETSFMKGFADALFKIKDKFYLIDWKTNWLGNNENAYSNECLEKEMIKSDYFLQASIYVNALKRYLQMKGIEDFDRAFGGMYYFFLRGLNSKNKGIYYFIPEPNEMYERVSQRTFC